MRADELVVEVRDSTLTRVGTIMPKDLSIAVFDIFNDAAPWKVTLPEGHPMCSPLRQPGSGIIVTYGSYVYSGPTTQPERTVTPADIAGTVTFAGVSDTIALADMLAWPNPLDITSTSTNGSITGKAETVMRTLVDQNLGSTALAARRKAGLVIDGTDQARGTTVVKYRKFQSLLELLQEIANPDGLGFRVVQRDTALSFEISSASDRSGAVRLSISNGGVASQKISTAAPGATHAIVAGQGWATSTNTIDYATTESLAAEAAWGRRIERYVEQSGSNITSELQRAGLEVLDKDGSTLLGIEVTPAEDSSLKFGTDWFLGDKVAVEIDSIEVVMQAKGVAIKVDEAGARMGMTMGDDGAFDDGGSRQLAGIETRVSALERSGSGGLIAQTQILYGIPFNLTNTTAANLGDVITFNSPGPQSVFIATMTIVGSAPAGIVNFCTFALDGAAWNDGVRTHSPNNGTYFTVSRTIHISGLAAGTHTFGMRSWNNGAGTTSILGPDSSLSIARVAQ